MNCIQIIIYNLQFINDLKKIIFYNPSLTNLSSKTSTQQPSTPYELLSGTTNRSCDFSSGRLGGWKAADNLFFVRMRNSRPIFSVTVPICVVGFQSHHNGEPMSKWLGNMPRSAMIFCKWPEPRRNSRQMHWDASCCPSCSICSDLWNGSWRPDFRVQREPPVIVFLCGYCFDAPTPNEGIFWSFYNSNSSITFCFWYFSWSILFKTIDL